MTQNTAWNHANALSFAERFWDERILPSLSDYIAIPAKSPAFDPDWARNGHIDHAVRHAADWVQAQQVPGLSLQVHRLPGRTPLLMFEIAATNGATNDATNGPTILMYGHLDKQPEAEGWRDGLGPWTPVYEDGRLYGRGGADDGYAVYASIAAVQAVKAQGMAHPRIVGLIEASEESGSPDLPAYLEQLAPQLGDVGLVVCLDSGAGDYERLWLTTSLRGSVGGTLTVRVLDEAVHSGDASGIVPSSFRIQRLLLDRLEDAATGRVLPDALHCDIPAERQRQAQDTAAILGDVLLRRYPWAQNAQGGHTQPMQTDVAQALLARTWRPTLSITGADGMPTPAQAGNALRTHTTLKLSLRLPPLVDGDKAQAAVKHLLESDPPYQAHVHYATEKASNGWNAPSATDWFAQALDTASRIGWGAPCAFNGQGGSIPLIGMLGAQFPRAQMMVCGVLGPQSNAHGPNEFLHVHYAKRLTAAVAAVISAMPTT